MIAGSNVPARFTMRNPSEVFVVDRLFQKYRFVVASPSEFSIFLIIDGGSECIPNVK